MQLAEIAAVGGRLEVRSGGVTRFLNGKVVRHDRHEEGGSVRYVIATERGGPQCLFVHAQDSESCRILDALKYVDDDRAVTLALAAIGTTLPEPPLIEGSIEFDGRILTVMAGDSRADFLLGSDDLPVVVEDEPADAEGGWIVTLKPPGSPPVRLSVSAGRTDATLKSIAVLRAEARGGPATVTVRWRYKIVRSTFSDNLEESLNVLGAAGWELVALTGIDGALSLTGNKFYAVLKRQTVDR